MTETAKLTARVKAAGCAAKLSPKILDQILPRIPRLRDDNVLVGFDTSDDAGIYRLNDSLALVQTVDFFTPMVDDPFTFGAIAAANALSDVYAMGGRPLTSLSVLCWPGDQDLDDLEAVLRGGAAKMAEAGCVILGGHSVRDDEIKFGFAVTGTVHPDRVWANKGARPGDRLVFTKKLGTGVISTAIKRGIAKEAHVNAAVEQMLTLNKESAESLSSAEIHACTDVTGFGLIAHAREMAMASGVTIELFTDEIPILDGALDYARAGAQPGGLTNNRNFAESCVEHARSLDPALEALLYDPQTSGGLLVSTSSNPGIGWTIGRVLDRGSKPIRVFMSDPRIIVALDVATADKAFELIDRLGESVSFYKVGMELYAAAGMSLVREVLSGGKKVFLDLKLYDIGETVKRTVAVVAASGVDLLTVHGSGQIARSAVEGRGDAPLKLLAVTVLTSFDESDLRGEGYPGTVSELVERRAKLALDAGIDGLVCSALEVARLREIAGPKKLLVTPGVRSAGAESGDQKRVASPADAIRCGASHLVIGRQITRAAEPKAEVRKIQAEISAVALPTP